jgi:hypothetical protein
VTDHGSDGRAASKLALDGAEDTTLLARDEDASRVMPKLLATGAVIGLTPTQARHDRIAIIRRAAQMGDGHGYL